MNDTGYNVECPFLISRLYVRYHLFHSEKVYFLENHVMVFPNIHRAIQSDFVQSDHASMNNHHVNIYMIWTLGEYMILVEFRLIPYSLNENDIFLLSRDWRDLSISLIHYRMI